MDKEFFAIGTDLTRCFAAGMSAGRTEIAGRLDDVYLVYLNEAVIGVCASCDRAIREAQSFMLVYEGTWTQLNDQAWVSHLGTRLGIERRTVVR